MFNPHKIRKLIDERKLSEKTFTKTKLLAAINLSSPSLNNIINGDSLPRIDTLEAIANYFKVDMNYFFDQYESKESLCVSEPLPEYGNDNPWKICFELQREITDLKVELERCEKFTDVADAATKAG